MVDRVVHRLGRAPLAREQERALQEVGGQAVEEGLAHVEDRQNGDFEIRRVVADHGEVKDARPLGVEPVNVQRIVARVFGLVVAVAILQEAARPELPVAEVQVCVASAVHVDEHNVDAVRGCRNLYREEDEAALRRHTLERFPWRQRKDIRGGYDHGSGGPDIKED